MFKAAGMAGRDATHGARSSGQTIRAGKMILCRSMALLGLLLLAVGCVAPAAPAQPAAEAAATTAPAEEAAAGRPAEISYVTPAQQEGPYYPVEKPADRDNDLTVLAGAAGAPAGRPVHFGGILYDREGMPVEGAVIEIWQTDANGVYLHPRDPGTESRDRNFQFYGEAVTGADGSYSFRTILPGEYEPRPRHIHVKVKLEGRELLTTQFYFAGEVALSGDQASLLIDLAEETDAEGNTVLVGRRDVVVGR